MPFKPSPRLKTFDYLGLYRYSLTICTVRRHAAFTEDAAVASALVQLRRTADAQSFAVIAYCFMPDHAHVLVEGTADSSDLREFVRIFKQRSAYQWKRAHGSTLWQRDYFEHVLRADEDTTAVARYILANPVRAGLAAAPNEYPFVGSLTMDLADLIESVQTEARPT
jgi:putative transposase